MVEVSEYEVFIDIYMILLRLYIFSFSIIKYIFICLKIYADEWR